ncbi:MAG: 30S ribosomal protein S5 [Chitinivibrionales bacterium]|nr:30S ribosomal protein S5 [Chitinivibrionales bacterium]
MNAEQTELTDKLIAVRRVAKVVKGGRRFGFSALVAVGDGRGTVGLGMGKANDVAESIRKAMESAKKSTEEVAIIDGTIPHEVIGRHGAGRILLKPAGPGTGIIAGGTARAILELAGVKNILTKVLGTTNPNNVAKATIQGLVSLRTREQVKALREPSTKE